MLGTYLHPTLGGADGTGWPHGQALRPSELLRVAQDRLEPGVRVERVAIALLDSATEPSDCAEVALGEYELVRLAALAVETRTAARAEAVL